MTTVDQCPSFVPSSNRYVCDRCGGTLREHSGAFPAEGVQQGWDFGLPPDDEFRAVRIAEWWAETSREEISKTVPKAIAYGSVDLEVVGEALLALLPDEAKAKVKRMSGEERKCFVEEMGIAFYVLGKVGRLFGAYHQGIAGTDDTWFDLGVYPKMAQRVRKEGQW